MGNGQVFSFDLSNLEATIIKDLEESCNLSCKTEEESYELWHERMVALLVELMVPTFQCGVINYTRNEMIITARTSVIVLDLNHLSIKKVISLHNVHSPISVFMRNDGGKTLLLLTRSEVFIIDLDAEIVKRFFPYGNFSSAAYCPELDVLSVADNERKVSVILCSGSNCEVLWRHDKTECSPFAEMYRGTEPFPFRINYDGSQVTRILSPQDRTTIDLKDESITFYSASIATDVERSSPTADHFDHFLVAVHDELREKNWRNEHDYRIRIHLLADQAMFNKLIERHSHESHAVYITIDEVFRMLEGIDLNSLPLVGEIKAPSSYLCCSLSRDGQHILIWDRDNWLFQYNCFTGKEELCWPPIDAYNIISCDFSESILSPELRKALLLNSGSVGP